MISDPSDPFTNPNLDGAIPPRLPEFTGFGGDLVVHHFHTKILASESASKFLFKLFEWIRDNNVVVNGRWRSDWLCEFHQNYLAPSASLTLFKVDHLMDGLTILSGCRPPTERLLEWIR